MFFLQTISNYKQRQIKSFSIAYRNDMEDILSSQNNPLMCKLNKSVRRTVFAPPMLVRGSMTLEATLVLPFFLLFMLSLYSVIDMLCLHAITTWNLHQVGNEICVYGSVADLIEAKEEGILDLVGDIGFSYLYIKDRLEQKVDFPGEVFFSTVSIFEGGKVSLVLTFQYPLFLNIGGRDSIWLQSRFEGMVWIGAEASLKDEWVYVTTSGEVYHWYADCSHLDLSIQELPLTYLEDLNDIFGKKIDECMFCTNMEREKVYITSEREKYHVNRECKGLKRTISLESLSEAQSKYAMCLRCKERKDNDE